MKTNITVLTLVLLPFLGCNEKEELFLTAESFTENSLDSCKNNLCAEITINYVIAFGEEGVSKKINSKIEKFIISSLMLGEDSIPSAKTIEEAASEFIATYKSDLQSFPDMTAGYFAEISVNELYRSEKLLCLEMRQYLFAGGAHGYGTTSFKNIDIETGEEFSDADIFKDKKEFAAFAEKKFRKQQSIPSDAPINGTGFWFANDAFYLSENMGFTPDTLIFIYNQYDIASYAEGPIELKIAMAEATPYLQVK